MSKLRSTFPNLCIQRAVSCLALLVHVLLASGCIVAAGIALVSAVDIAVDRQSIGSKVDDTSIELRIDQSFYADAELREASRIKATSVHGFVLLVGEVPSRQAGLRAARIAGSTQNVVQVLNKTTVAPVADQAMQRQEAWLTTRAKTRMVKVTGTRGARVNIVVHRDIVYLMGLVTEAEGDVVANSIRHVKGIHSIIKVFEYVE